MDQYAIDIYEPFYLGDEFFILQSVFVDENIIYANLIKARNPSFFAKKMSVQILEAKEKGQELSAFGIGNSSIEINEN